MSAWLQSLRDDLHFVRHRFLTAVAALHDEDLGYQPVPTLMSARQQLLHVAWAESFWRGRVTGEPPVERILDSGQTRAELLALLDAQRDRTLALLGGLTDADLTRPVTDLEGRALSVVWVLNHLVRHDAHHAGQLLVLFRLRHPEDPVGSGYARILDTLPE